MKSGKGVVVVAGAALSVAAVAVFVILGWWEAALIVIVAVQAAIVALLVWMIARLPSKSDVRRTVTSAADRVTSAHRSGTAAVRDEIRAGADRAVEAAHTVGAAVGSAVESVGATAESVETNVTDVRSALSASATTQASIQAAVASTETALSSVQAQLSSVDEGLASVADGLARTDATMSAADRHRSTFERQIGWRFNRQMSHVEGLFQLYLRDAGARAMPLSGQWALDSYSLSAALDAIERRRPDVVVELGSGTSTAWIARLLEQLGTGRVVSLDHEQSYAQETATAIERLGLTERVDLRVVDLVPTGLEDHDTPWYDATALRDIEQIDVLLIDGPPKKTGSLARYPAVPVLFDQLSDGALIMVDDANRDDESTMIQRWQEAYPGLHEVIAVPRSDMRILRKG